MTSTKPPTPSSAALANNSQPQKTYEFTGDHLTTADLVQIAKHKAKVKLSDEARQKMQTSRDYIEKRIKAGEVMYGVNTGFGAFSEVRISDEEIEELQRNLIRSHSVGIGQPFTQTQTRAIMALRANALARGHSGIRPAVVEKIIEFLNNDIIPYIPEKGSVGASGDLAPLSHHALALMGEGEIWGADGQPKEAAEELKKKNIEPLTLKAKEGLSLINGCQVMTAVGLLALDQGENLLKVADIAGSLSLEALRGSRTAFDPLISGSRPHKGEMQTAKNLRQILQENSAIAVSHENCGKVQDAYSLRCMPAVHGSVKDTYNYVRQVLEREANSSTDNPLVFAQDNKILSGGNFHGAPVAAAMDFAAISFTTLSSISECRSEKLINPSMSDLPAFLAPKGGLNSGHMIVQVAAASLVSENKILSHPASVDSIPTSADKEDHVSMGTIAARKFANIISNVTHVLAMELLSATQALDLLKPLKPEGALKEAYDLIRSKVPFAEKDRVFAKDIEQIKILMESGELVRVVEKQAGEIQIR